MTTASSTPRQGIAGLQMPTFTAVAERSRLQFFARATGQEDLVYTDLQAARDAGYDDLPIPPTFLFGLERDGVELPRLLQELQIDMRQILHGEQGFVYHRVAVAGENLHFAPRMVDDYHKRDGAPGSRPRNRGDLRWCAGRGASQCDRRSPLGALVNTANATKVGDVLPPLELAPISRTALSLFACASCDHNPIHVDIDVARSAGLDDVICHGMLSMAYLGRLMTNWLPQSQLRSFSVRFVSITPVHGRPTCRGVVTAIERINGESVGTVHLEVVLADDTPTLTGIATVTLREAE
jgi:acyl dehydratase